MTFKNKEELLVNEQTSCNNLNNNSLQSTLYWSVKIITRQEILTARNNSDATNEDATDDEELTKGTTDK